MILFFEHIFRNGLDRHKAVVYTEYVEQFYRPLNTS